MKLNFVGIMLLLSLLSSLGLAEDVPLILQQKSFVFVVPSFNNKLWYKRNLDSMFNQRYQNYRVIYIDDASTDDTGNLVQAYVNEKGMSHKVKVIKNQTNQSALANIYNAVHSCAPDEIIVTLDGDDWLYDQYVLDHLARVYQNPDIWITYGQFIEWPIVEKPTWVRPIPQNIIDQNDIRHYEFVSSHLRTFYAGLFHKIKKEDLCVDGHFLMATYDIAIMFPMLEMAHNRSRFISRALYVYNTATMLNDHKLRRPLQIAMDKLVRSRSKYEPIESLFGDAAGKKADLIVFSYDRPLQLYAFLESVEKFVSNVGRISVIYRTSSSEYDVAYNKCFDSFKKLSLVAKKQNAQHNDFQALTLDALQGSSDYVMFAVDDDVVTDYIDLENVITYLQRTNAYGFYFRLGENITQCYTMNRANPVPNHSLLDDNVLQWKFADGVYDWNYPNNVDLTVYRTRDILPIIKGLSFKSPNQFEAEWDKVGQHNGDRNRLGLCYRQSKIINIPFNIVQQDYTKNRHMTYSKDDFLRIFNEGNRLDIKQYSFSNVQSLHVEMPLYVVKKTSKFDEVSIGLCITATNKYVQFLEPFLNSCRNYFFKNRSVTYFVFTNQPIAPQPDVVVIPIEHQPWPGPTLMRFENYYKAFEQWKHMDYMFACDVDMCFVAPAGDEMLGNLVAVKHPGFYNKSRSEFTYESQETSSKAYVGPLEGTAYYAGGFYGGSTKEFFRLVKTNSENIRIDLGSNFVARWHDESHLNRYFIDHKPTIILSPAYCYPESWSLPFDKILLALDKNHDKVRSEL